jgi:hypothetical protein
LKDAPIKHKEEEFVNDTETMRVILGGPIFKLIMIWEGTIEALYQSSDNDAGGGHNLRVLIERERQRQTNQRN